MVEDHCSRLLAKLKQLYPEQSLPNGLVALSAIIRFKIDMYVRRFFQKLQWYSEKQHKGANGTETSKCSVYDSAKAIIAFLTHPTNDALYDIVATVLARELTRIKERMKRTSNLAHLESTKLFSAIDIGSGPGVLLEKVIRNIGDSNEIGWTVLEPAAELLKENAKVLSRVGVEATTLNESLQAYVDVAASVQDSKIYSAGLITFALSALPKAERKSVLDKLARTVKSLFIVEFNCDIPGMACTSGSGLFADERVRAVAEKYAKAYPLYFEAEQILDKFLIPAFFGFFDESSKRVTHEQSLDEWCKELQQLDNYTVAVVAPALGTFW